MWTDRRRLVPVIALSLLLNVFLVGIIAGHLYAGAAPLAERGGLVPAAHVRALPPDEKKKFLDAMADRKPGIQAARKAHQAARRLIESEIAAPEFDRAKVTAGFAALRQASAALQVQAHSALVEALAVLSPASRAALVARAAPGEDGR